VGTEIAKRGGIEKSSVAKRDDHAAPFLLTDEEACYLICTFEVVLPERMM
jgi:hypothetical protein